MAIETPAGWYADPMGRYDHRYWDGTQWTENVARGGQQAVDPVVAAAPSSEPADASQSILATTATAAAGEGAPPTQATAPQPQNAAAATPLKLCPHCHVQSNTTATTCPSCGKRYIQKKKWPWVVGAIFLVMMVGFAGCVAVIGTAAKHAVDVLNTEQARHAITPSQFDAVQLGSSRVDVISRLGKAPEDAQQFVQRGILNGQDLNSSCIYYNKAGGSFGDRYQFCFQNDSLSSKNAY